MLHTFGKWERVSVDRKETPWRLVVIEKDAKDRDKDIVLGSGFALAESPGRVYTSSRCIQQVLPNRGYRYGCKIFTPSKTVVMPLLEYQSLDDATKKEPTANALADAGACFCSGYQSLAPPLLEMAERSSLQGLTLDEAPEAGLYGIDIAAVQVDPRSPLGPGGFAVETDAVTVTAVGGMAALVLGLHGGRLSYFTVGPPKDGTFSHFPGSLCINNVEGWTDFTYRFDELESLSGGPMLIPPQGDGGESPPLVPLPLFLLPSASGAGI